MPDRDDFGQLPVRLRCRLMLFAIAYASFVRRTIQEREGSVDEFHLDAFQGLGGGWDVQEVQDDGLFRSQHRTTCDHGCQCITDLACSIVRAMFRPGQHAFVVVIAIGPHVDVAACTTFILLESLSTLASRLSFVVSFRLTCCTGDHHLERLVWALLLSKHVDGGGRAVCVPGV